MASVDINDLNGEFARRMALLLRDAKAAGIGGVSINSGYRSIDQQKNLWNNRASNPNPVAPPGGSMHNFGYAVDVQGKDLQKLRDFASAHPEYGIQPLAGDKPHFQFANMKLADLRANPPTTESGVDLDEVHKYLANFGIVAPGATPDGNLAPPPPAAYATTGATPPTPTGTPIPNFGTTITSTPNTGATVATPPATPDQPSAASLLGKGDVGGAFGAAMGNPLVKSGADALGKGLASHAPDIKPPEMPNIQDNSAAIAQQAPQMMAALLAQIRARQQPQGDAQGLQIPGLTLNRRPLF